MYIYKNKNKKMYKFIYKENADMRDMQHIAS